MKNQRRKGRLRDDPNAVPVKEVQYKCATCSKEYTIRHWEDGDWSFHNPASPTFCVIGACCLLGYGNSVVLPTEEAPNG
jgi:hypothetical protein